MDSSDFQKALGSKLMDNMVNQMISGQAPAQQQQQQQQQQQGSWNKGGQGQRSYSHSGGFNSGPTLKEQVADLTTIIKSMAGGPKTFF